MDVPKRLQDRLIFFFLVIFPFGQLVRIDIGFLGRNIPLHPIDLIAGMSIPFLLFVKKRPRTWRLLKTFLVIAVFSYLFSIFFAGGLALKGSLYLVRLLSYFSFFVFVWDFVKQSAKKKRRVFNGLIFVILAVALFGWIQYFLYPDFRAFVVYEWDDHLYRLVSTFFDPGFTSVLLVFGTMASTVLYLKFRDKRWLILSGFLVVSLLFTYSRAGYLALFGGLLAIAAMKRLLRIALFTILVFIALLAFLPRPAGEGVRLERTASIYARLRNYSETLTIAKSSPVFGVGYNNLCAARERVLGNAEFDSHSCYGADSSLLFVLATTGVVGLSIFVYLLYKMTVSVSNDIYGQTFIASGAALLFHSVFTNSIFYPWVLGWMLALYAISVKGVMKSN